uniref:Uncharacterized protein n=1 Tax=Arundo donax TaxID=35708 RepID=A0A0A9B9L6_ARUDO
MKFRDPSRMVCLIMGCRRMCCVALGFVFAPVCDLKDRFLEFVPGDKCNQIKGLIWVAWPSN